MSNFKNPLFPLNKKNREIELRKALIANPNVTSVPLSHNVKLPTFLKPLLAQTYWVFELFWILQKRNLLLYRLYYFRRTIQRKPSSIIKVIATNPSRIAPGQHLPIILPINYFRPNSILPSILLTGRGFKFKSVKNSLKFLENVLTVL